jgi:hypothetical protein
VRTIGSCVSHIHAHTLKSVLSRMDTHLTPGGRPSPASLHTHPSVPKLPLPCLGSLLS